jgi:integrase
MRRSEIDFEDALWRVPAERTKLRRPHDIPLSRQALRVLKQVWPVSEFGEYVFPAQRSLRTPLPKNAMIWALRRMGFNRDEVTAFGFRGNARKILAERGFNEAVIGAALGHQQDNDDKLAYNRATYWRERVELMQAWADMLDEFKRI